MKDIFLSNCEKNFVQKLISDGHRLDGRTYDESRTLDIQIGSEYGSCIVSLGETKVIAQVLCEVVQPKQIRPNEGVLYINVEIGPMAAPQFEANRQTDLGVYLNRLLEKCYKDSKCIDLESLCIVVEEKVWSLRVDIKILNHDGNLIECASIATLTSLAHFKRPDVTRSGDSVIIHTLVEKDPIPTVLYHYPVCVSFAICNNDILLSDPNLLEELVCTSSTEEGIGAGGGGALVVVGVNQYRELCLLELRGAAARGAGAVCVAARAAAERARDLVERVRAALADDDAKRRKRKKINFSDAINEVSLMSLSRELTIRLKNYSTDPAGADLEHMEEEVEISKYEIVPRKGESADAVARGGASAWIEVSSDSDDDSPPTLSTATS